MVHIWYQHATEIDSLTHGKRQGCIRSISVQEDGGWCTLRVESNHTMSFLCAHYWKGSLKISLLSPASIIQCIYCQHRWCSFLQYMGKTRKRGSTPPVSMCWRRTLSVFGQQKHISGFWLLANILVKITYSTYCVAKRPKSALQC